MYDAHGDGGGAGASGVAEADFDPSDGGSASVGVGVGGVVGVGVGVGDVDDDGGGVGSGMEVDGESDGVFGNYAELMREQDCVLPMASVARIMKRSLPSNAKLAGDSKDTVQECASEFINFITSEYPRHAGRWAQGTGRARGGELQRRRGARLLGKGPGITELDGARARPCPSSL